MQERKLAAIYQVWDSLEQLESSVRSIIDVVDYVIIGASDYSRTGLTYEIGGLSPAEYVMERIFPQFAENLQRKIILICNPIKPKNIKLSRIELQKAELRDRIGLAKFAQPEGAIFTQREGGRFAQSEGATDALVIDADERYNTEQLRTKWAQYKAHPLGSVVYYAELDTYYLDENYRLEDRENYYVVLFQPIDKLTNKLKATSFLTDRTRFLTGHNAKEHVLIEFPVMQHYSYVRQDWESFERKFNGSVFHKELNERKQYILADQEKIKAGVDRFESQFYKSMFGDGMKNHHVIRVQ
jgi:hypothetical protein